MNQAIIIGNLTDEPELRQGNNTAICRFTVATNDGYGQSEETNYHRVVVFGRQAENAKKYLGKGRKVGIVGRISYGSYEKDGRKIYTTDIIANSVEYLSKAENGGMAEAQHYGGGNNHNGGFGGQNDYYEY